MTMPKPHFFQPIILPESSLHLTIPKAFQEKYLVGENCEGEAILKSNTFSDTSWTVKLTGFKFQDGWSDFFRMHDLRFGDFVVFRYEGDMVFHVMVFDSSFYEIEYPPFDQAIKTEDDQKKERKIDNRKGKEQALMNNHKNKKTHEEAVEGGGEKAEHPSFAAATMIKINFNSKMPYMNIPPNFARANIPQSKDSVVFMDEKGRAWPINLLRRQLRNRVTLSRGWLEFAVANGLKEGDFCVFQLISSKEEEEDLIEFKVSLLST